MSLKLDIPFLTRLGRKANLGYPRVTHGMTYGVPLENLVVQKNLTPCWSSLPKTWALPRLTKTLRDFSMTSGSIAWNSVSQSVSN